MPANATRCKKPPIASLEHPLAEEAVTLVVVGKHGKLRAQLAGIPQADAQLSHAPERGTHCVRVYGLYHSACRPRLNQARSRLGQPPYEPEAEPPDSHELLHRMFPDFTGDLCPKCRCRLVTVKVIRCGRSPPLPGVAA